MWREPVGERWRPQHVHLGRRVRKNRRLGGEHHHGRCTREGHVVTRMRNGGMGEMDNRRGGLRNHRGLRQMHCRLGTDYGRT